MDKITSAIDQYLSRFGDEHQELRSRLEQVKVLIAKITAAETESDPCVECNGTGNWNTGGVARQCPFCDGTGECGDETERTKVPGGDRTRRS